MTRLKFFLFAIVFFIGLTSFLPAGDSAVNSEISGFIKFDGYYDTRQITSAREGHFHLYPKDIDKDSEGNDLNAVSNINMVNFQSRVRIKINAPEALGAKVSGLLEADFFGADDGNEDELRLRHATIKLDWVSSQLLIGQYWSPLFTPTVYPQTVSFNTGMPFQPFARNPQIRYTVKMGNNLAVFGAATMQRDAYQEIGGRVKQQMSGLPGMHGNAELGNAKTLVGAGGHLRFIRNDAASDVMSSLGLTGYGKLVGYKFALRGKMVFGGDMTDQLMLGGYAVLTDTLSGSVEYKPLQTVSAWFDITSVGKPITVGIFGGYSNNLGVDSDMASNVAGDLTTTTRCPNITGLWRLSPRAVYNAGKLRFAFELEITSALYAGDYEQNLAPKELADDERVTNIRGLFATYLFF